MKGERFEAIFSKKEGTLSAYTLNNAPLISKGIELNLFRAPTDNDKQVSNDWQRKGLYQLQTEAGKWETVQEEGKITLHIRNTHKGQLGFKYHTEIEYTVNADGSILVNSIIQPAAHGDIIPRVGYRMELPEGFERIRWYGRGPWENYVDRKNATPMGLYESTVSEQWVNYVKPQEMGNHEEVRWISVTNTDGLGFVFVAGDQMSASALHVRAQDMADPNHLQRLIHKYNIPMRKETVLCLDAHNRPLGNASCGPGPMKKYELQASPIVFSFIMIPLERSYTQSELTKKARVQMPMCMPVMAERDNNGYLQMSTSTPETTIFYSINGNEYREYTGSFEFINGGKVQAYAISKKLGKSLVTTVELPIYVDRSAWKIAFSSSEDQGEEAQNAIDGDLSTYWHTRWHEPIPGFPHSIVVDMASLLVVDKFIYTARQGNDNGHVKDYELSFSKDGKNWEGTVKGSFSNLTSAQTVTLKTPIVARYFKFTPLSEMHGRKWASVAELNVSILKNISGVSQNRQTVVSVDSDADNSMKLATDGNINTYWHTVHNQFYIAPYPHEMHLALSKEATVKGIRYTPRQDSEEGRIASYEVYTSKDGKNWGQPITSGTFNIGTATQTIEFTPCRARYVKLSGLSAHDKGKKAAIAELEIILEE